MTKNFGKGDLPWWIHLPFGLPAKEMYSYVVPFSYIFLHACAQKKYFAHGSWLFQNSQLLCHPDAFSLPGLGNFPKLKVCSLPLNSFWKQRIIFSSPYQGGLLVLVRIVLKTGFFDCPCSISFWLLTEGFLDLFAHLYTTCTLGGWLDALVG